MDFSEARKALWHLRQGGPRQLHTFLRRSRHSHISIPAVGVSSRGAGAVPFAGRGTVEVSDFPEFTWPAIDPRRNLRVGVIADTFTRRAFDYEWVSVPLDPDTPFEQLDGLDLLFVESAWHGNDDAWQYQLTGSHAPSSALRDLVAECRRRGIPTVFWNKEDPVHFEDFLDTARLFEWVFTTEGERIAEYVRLLGHSRVRLLPFAAQPAIHNPMGRMREKEARDIAFAGTYFAHKYPERRAQMDVLLGGAIDVKERYGYSVDIFARFQGIDPRYSFPEPYGSLVRGELSYAQALLAYRSYHSFINVNSIPRSDTMCARRIFEITACGAMVVSAPSPAITEFLGDAVVVSDDRNDAGRTFRALLRSPELRDRLTYQGQMAIWAKHTYSHRVDEILRAVGLDAHCTGNFGVSILVSTIRPHQVRHVLDQIAAQESVTIQPLILTHGFDPDPRDVAYAKSLGLSVEWVYGDPSWTLGHCYNVLLEKAVFPLSAKFDDDDEYGPHYLLEQAMAQYYSGAQLVGKQSHFVHLGGERHSVRAFRSPGRDHCETDFVSGPTFVFDTEYVRAIGFEDRSLGEDTALLKSISAAGGKIWSTSRFGFIQMRQADGHTWRISSMDILANCDVVSGDFTGV